MVCHFKTALLQSKRLCFVLHVNTVHTNVWTHICKSLPGCIVVTLSRVSKVILQSPKFLVQIKINGNIAVMKMERRQHYFLLLYYVILHSNNRAQCCINNTKTKERILFFEKHDWVFFLLINYIVCLHVIYSRLLILDIKQQR